MDSCPKELEPFIKAHKKVIQEHDHLAWLSNQYTLSAVSVVIDHCLHGQKAKSEYIKEPILSKAFEKDGLTEEQIAEKELRKALLAEEQWINAGKLRGLPETVI